MNFISFPTLMCYAGPTGVPGDFYDGFMDAKKEERTLVLSPIISTYLFNLYNNRCNI